MGLPTYACPGSTCHELDKKKCSFEVAYDHLKIECGSALITCQAPHCTTSFTRKEILEAKAMTQLSMILKDPSKHRLIAHIIECSYKAETSITELQELEINIVLIRQLLQEIRPDLYQSERDSDQVRMGDSEFEESLQYSSGLFSFRID